MNEPLYSAKKVAARLEISLPDIEFVCGEVRLEQGKGWQTLAGEMVLTREGLESILNHLRTAMNKPPPEDPLNFTADIVAAPVASDIAELTVQRTFPNPRLLQAMTAAGELVVVEVKNNLNFLPKMKLSAHFVRAGRYHFKGQCPRHRGRF